MTELFCSVTSLVSDVPEKFPSDLTLFLVGSGIALLIALLAWGEQIRSLAKDTRDLEREFRQKHHVDPESFRTITDPEAKPADRSYALMRIVIDGTISEADQFMLLQLFSKWKPLSTQLKHRYDLKYRLTLLLTGTLLGMGLLSVWLPADASITLHQYTIRFGTTSFVVAGAILAYQLVLLISIGHSEQRLHTVLTGILERL